MYGNLLCKQRSRIIDATSQPSLLLGIDQHFLQTRTHSRSVPTHHITTQLQNSSILTLRSPSQASVFCGMQRDEAMR